MRGCIGLLLKPTTSWAWRRCSTPFIASIPYEWYTNNDIAGFEGYYASVFYSYFAALGSGHHRGGQQQPRALWTWRSCSTVTCLLCSSSRWWSWRLGSAALAQLQAAALRGQVSGVWGSRYHLIGVEFSKDERNVAAFDVERA